MSFPLGLHLRSRRMRPRARRSSSLDRFAQARGASRRSCLRCSDEPGRQPVGARSDKSLAPARIGPGRRRWQHLAYRDHWRVDGARDATRGLHRPRYGRPGARCEGDSPDAVRCVVPRGNPGGLNKNGPAVVGGTVALDGTIIRDGDLVIADEDGVVIWPKEHIDDLLARAQAKLQEDNARLVQLQEGEECR